MNRFSTPPSSRSKFPHHPTTNETIHRIIDMMASETDYPFEEVWAICFDRVEGERHFNARQSRRCFNQLISEGLVTSNKKLDKDYYGGNSDVTIRLTNFGDKVREGTGWLEHVKKRGKLLNRAVKIAVIVEVGVILVEAIIIYAQYKNNTSMERTLEQVNGEYRSLERLVQDDYRRINHLDSILKTEREKTKNLEATILKLQVPAKPKKR